VLGRFESVWAYRTPWQALLPSRLPQADQGLEAPSMDIRHKSATTDLCPAWASLAASSAVVVQAAEWPSMGHTCVLDEHVLLAAILVIGTLVDMDPLVEASASHTKLGAQLEAD
jgi:hypothetical protein